MKLQAAIEYLTTYGWALLVITVVLAAFFMLGISAPPTPQCMLPAGLSCATFYMATNGLLSVTLLQAMQVPINITALGCSLNNTVMNMQAPYNPPTNQINMQIGGLASFTVQCYASPLVTFSGNPGTSFSGYLFVNYTDVYTGFPHTAFGKLLVQIT